MIGHGYVRRCSVMVLSKRLLFGWSGVRQLHDNATAMPWLYIGERLRDLRDMFRRRAAASARHIHQARLRKFLQQARRDRPGFVEARIAHRIRQTRIRIARHIGVAELRQIGDIRPHQRRAQRAVQSEREWPRMTQRVPESLDGLSRQDATRRVVAVPEIMIGNARLCLQTT